MSEGTNNAKREDTRVTSRLKAMVRPFNKKRRRKKNRKRKRFKRKHNEFIFE